jgi:hypothetical protein
VASKKTQRRHAQYARARARKRGELPPAPERQAPKPVDKQAKYERELAKRYGFPDGWPAREPEPLPVVDDSKHRPKAIDPLLTGAGRVTGVAAKAVKRSKAMTRTEYLAAERQTR